MEYSSNARDICCKSKISPLRSFLGGKLFFIFSKFRQLTASFSVTMLIIRDFMLYILEYYISLMSV